MQKVAVQELNPFNVREQEHPFYIDVIFRKIKPMPHTGIYHYHDNIELIYCKSGKLKITFISGEIILEPGDFIFINSNIPHSTDPYDGENEHYCIKFDSSILDIKTSRPMPDSRYFLSLLPDQALFLNSDDSAQIHELFKRCSENFTHNNYTKRLVLQASLMEIMAYIFNKNIDAEYLNDEERSNVLLNSLAYIRENFSTITLEDAAKNASMSYSYFSRVFKKEFNISFSKFVTKLRLEKSLALLSNSSLSITEIAMECGFSNLSHYVNCLKNEKGITPNKFRALVKNKNH